MKLSKGVDIVNIVIVEDDIFLREELQNILQKEG